MGIWSWGTTTRRWMNPTRYLTSPSAHSPLMWVPWHTHAYVQWVTWYAHTHTSLCWTLYCSSLSSCSTHHNINLDLWPQRQNSAAMQLQSICISQLKGGLVIQDEICPKSMLLTCTRMLYRCTCMPSNIMGWMCSVSVVFGTWEVIAGMWECTQIVNRKVSPVLHCNYDIILVGAH